MMIIFYKKKKKKLKKIKESFLEKAKRGLG